jgi:single-stranded DNA-binding protein
MAQGNYVFVLGDITGDIYFDFLRPKNQAPIPFLRLYLMINGSRDSKQVRGLRILVYGSDAEIIFGHVQKGSRIGVQGHIQMRNRPNTTTPVFEVVAEHIEFIRNIDYEGGRNAIAELKNRGNRPNHSSEDLEIIKSLLDEGEIAHDPE